MYSKSRLYPAGARVIARIKSTCLAGGVVPPPSMGDSGMSASEAAVKARRLWMGFAGHRANILDPAYTQVGAGFGGRRGEPGAVCAGVRRAPRRGGLLMTSARTRFVSAMASAAMLMLLSPGMAFAQEPGSQPPLVSHGPDPATELLKRESTSLGSAAVEDSSAPTVRRAPGPGWCGSERASDDAEDEVTNGDGKFHVIYAHAADQGNRFAQLATYIEEAALESSNIMARARGRALRYDLGTDCGSRNLDISAVRLSKTASELDRDRNGNRTFGLVADELKARGFDSGAKNYLVFLDAPERHLCGEGAGFGDNRRSAENYNEGGSRYAIVYRPFDTTQPDGGFCGGAALHEQLHVLGIVPPAAPHNNGSGHCNDAREDVICGDAPSRGGGPYVDWNSDDYWDPARGALGWWTANLSRYVCPDASCNSGEPVDYLPAAPAGYRGPRYQLRFYNVDDDHCAYVERPPGGQQVRLFCAGYRADRTEDITGALLAMTGGGSPARLRLVARNHNPGGGRTLGMSLRRGDGTLIVDERHGVVGSESSDLPESEPDPGTGFATFFDRTVELDLREPPPAAPGPSPQPGSGTSLPGPDNGDSDFDGDPWFGDGSDDSAGSTPGRRCREATRSLRQYERRAARTRRRVRAERRGLMRRRHALEARGWPRPAARSYRQARRRYDRRYGALKRLDRHVRTLRGQRRRACR